MAVVSKRRTKPAEERRADLLDATERLVLATGADGFTVDDVTTGAGVAKGTFYLQFSSKGDLLDGLRERYLNRFAEYQITEARRFDGVESVQAWARAGVDAYLNDLRLHDVLFHPTARGERDVPNSVITALTDLLASLDPPPTDPFVAAVLVYSSMHGATDHIVHCPDDSERTIAGLNDLIVKYLSP